ncbi:asparginase [Paecilomyces variotii No. 5]|uniref:Asparginase n=1 Tax=Byssochlamys spectabilis (strain No. 5 / NBRC 109023) TaxID=1356009 RepID=V5G554_BYSSN|nr:asparginase [Paecilomyces variotii No. 5]
MTPRHREGGDIAAIFVHAGAGYHSVQNERIHLEACNEAARVAMTLLRNGGSAVDAVEMAVALMEDHEITNAGYGSNLTVDGTVECDATVVDHLGRSGAVGAVSQIKNPISLARKILDASTKPLSLHRVPPNLLVGPGASDFAYDNGMHVLPPDFLVSDAAKERWRRWRQDLQAADRQAMIELEERMELERQDNPYMISDYPGIVRPTQVISPPSSVEPNLAVDAAASPNTAGVTRGTAIEDGANTSRGIDQDQHIDSTVIQDHLHDFMEYGHYQMPQDDVDNSFSWEQRPSNILRDSDGPSGHDGQLKSAAKLPVRPRHPEHAEIAPGEDGQSRISSPTPHRTFPAQGQDGHEDDKITDTVGAIAVDCYGNIAAASSSGGIGMKHRGRVGPAALVGIGTAVIPADQDDADRVSVATVTSGTGEHMATTMAASTCASRIYSSQRKGEGGMLEEVTEDEAIKAMIEKDFMDHVGVKNSHCQAAIGIMAVKKTKDGVFLFFGHNTDSFALASMSSEERKPVCVMSRSNGNGSIAQGGRAYRHRRYRVRHFPAGDF